MTKTRIVLIRHGESNVTVQRVLGGPRTCSGLSDLGKMQAERLRDRLANTRELQCDVLYSSGYPRARETAEIIAPALSSLAINIDTRFGEHDPGPECDGLTFAEFVRRHGSPDWGGDPHAEFFPGGETKELASGAQGTVYSVQSEGESSVYKKIIANQDITRRQLTEGDLAAAQLQGAGNIAAPTHFFIQVKRDGVSDVVKVPAEGVQGWCSKLLDMQADLKMVGILMPKAPGETVDKKMREGFFLIPDNFKLLAKGLLDGLKQMHEKSLVFHDMKPANALFDPETNKVTLVDLGEVVQLDKENPTTSKRAGSELMMAPQVNNRRPHGTEVDYYSLAVTLLVAVSITETVPSLRFVT